MIKLTKPRRRPAQFVRPIKIVCIHQGKGWYLYASLTKGLKNGRAPAPYTSLPRKSFELRKKTYVPRWGRSPTADELDAIRSAVRVLWLRHRIEWLDHVREEGDGFPKRWMADEFSLYSRELEGLESDLGFLVEDAG